MPEKYIGILPPGSIWYRISQEEILILLPFLQTQSKKAGINIDGAEQLEYIEVQAPQGNLEKFEKIFTDAGLKIENKG